MCKVQLKTCCDKGDCEEYEKHLFYILQRSNRELQPDVLTARTSKRLREHMVFFRAKALMCARHVLVQCFKEDGNAKNEAAR